MNPFEYYIPTHIHFGRGIAKSLGDDEHIAGRNVLVLPFPGFSRKDVLDGIAASAARCVILDDFMENPGAGFVRGIAGRLRRESVDTIVAIGGGSSIDTAKGAAYYAAEDGGQPVTVIAVPTTAGTGSEVTPYAILTDEQTGAKTILNGPSLFPDFAYCDPELTATMPARVTANTAIDALTHAVEGLCSSKCGGFLETLGLDASRRIIDALPRVLLRPDDLDPREALMLAALEAGLVLARCGTVLVHAMGYELTENYHLPHGHANALLLAAFIRMMTGKGNESARKVMEWMGNEPDLFIRRNGIMIPEAINSMSQININAIINRGLQNYGINNSTHVISREEISNMIDESFFVSQVM